MFYASAFQTMVQPQQMNLRDSYPIDQNPPKVYENLATPNYQTKKTKAEKENCFVLQGMDSAIVQNLQWNNNSEYTIVMQLP